MDRSVGNRNRLITDLLIRSGADVNSVSDSGSTALFYAARAEDPDTLKELITAGANPDIQDKNGNTALHGASANNSSDCAKELLKAGVDVNVQRKDGRTALMEACSSNALGTVQELIRAGAAVNKQDQAGNTALIISVNNYCLKELIKSGADLNIRNKDGWTAISSAWKRENYCRILWEAGADVDTAWLTSLVYERYRFQTAVYFKKRIRFDFFYLYWNLVSEDGRRAFDTQSKFIFTHMQIWGGGRV